MDRVWGDSVLVGWKVVLKTADCSQADHTQKEGEREREREKNNQINLDGQMGKTI